MEADSIKKGLEEVRQILEGSKIPERETIYEGPIRVREIERGKVTFDLKEAVAHIKGLTFSNGDQPAKKLRIIREILGQSQNGMAFIFGVPKRTYERWEIDDSKGVKASSKLSLIELMAEEPQALIRYARKRSKLVSA